MSDQLSRRSARRLYERLGSLYDLAACFEAHAKRRALDLLDLQPGSCALDLGAGTGHDVTHLSGFVEPNGLAIALDVAYSMTRIARSRSGTPAVQAAAQELPFARRTFDAVFAAYLFDLLSPREHTAVLRQVRSVLRPGGQVLIVALTEGVGPVSHAFVAVWEWVYARSPWLCGGCRPLQLQGALDRAGFERIQREVVVQLGVPSEVVSGRAPKSPPPPAPRRATPAGS